MKYKKRPWRTRGFPPTPYLLTISSRLSRFPSGNLEPNVHTSPLCRDGQRTLVFIDGIHNFFEFFIAFSSYYYYTCTRIIIFSLSLCLALFSVRLVRFSFHRQNRDNGFIVLLHTNIHIKFCPGSYAIIVFFSNSSALQIFHSLFNKFLFNTFLFGSTEIRY